MQKTTTLVIHVSSLPSGSLSWEAPTRIAIVAVESNVVSRNKDINLALTVSMLRSECSKRC